MSQGYREILSTRFKFTNQLLSERKLQIKYERRLSDEWMLALMSTDKVCVAYA